MLKEGVTPGGQKEATGFESSDYMYTAFPLWTNGGNVAGPGDAMISRS